MQRVREYKTAQKQTALIADWHPAERSVVYLLACFDHLSQQRPQRKHKKKEGRKEGGEKGQCQ